MSSSHFHQLMLNLLAWRLSCRPGLLKYGLLWNSYLIFSKSDNFSDDYILKSLNRDIHLPRDVVETACQLVTRSIIQTS